MNFYEIKHELLLYMQIFRACFQPLVFFYWVENQHRMIISPVHLTTLRLKLI